MQTKIVLLAILTGMSWVCFWFMVRRPKQWSALVDKENAFWVNRGWLPASFSEKVKRIEKSLVLKMMIGLAAAVGTVIVTYGLWVLTHG